MPLKASSKASSKDAALPASLPETRRVPRFEALSRCHFYLLPKGSKASSKASSKDAALPASCLTVCHARWVSVQVPLLLALQRLCVVRKVPAKLRGGAACD